MKFKIMVNKHHSVLDYWSVVTLKMANEFAVFFSFIAVEADAILISSKIVSGYQPFVIPNVKDLLCKMYALFKQLYKISYFM